MSRISIIGALTLAGVVYTVGCGEPGDQIETRSSAVGGSGCLIDAAGWQVPFWTYGMRGFTDANGVHLGVFHTFGSSTITEATLTPFSSAADLGGNLMAGSTPWGYRRHDGVSAVLYLDPNGHIHERTSADVDITALYASWTVAAGPEDSNAEVPDVIGYIRSDGKSAIVVRGSNNDVWEIRSNFGSQPPWLATDLTAVSRAPYKVSWGSAFPYVRSDGANTIVYIATDNHIHELASWGNGAWGDADLSAAAGDTRAMPTSPPWGYQRSDRYNTVVFIGSDERVHELAYFPGGRWSTANLPSVPVVTPRSTHSCNRRTSRSGAAPSASSSRRQVP